MLYFTKYDHVVELHFCDRQATTL